MDSCASCRRLVSALARGSEDSTATEAETGEGGNLHGPVPGERIGRLSVLERLGQGGMGTVYAAYDAKLDRKVALKFLRKVHDRAAGRLLREAQSLAQLNHPNVVQVHDFGEYQNRSYISMEYCAGQTLGAWCTEQEPSWQEIVRLLLLAGQGVAAAHRVGLVHRDFKPSNVMVTSDGEVKVMDLGLARRERDGGVVALGADTATSSVPVLETKTGTIMGTPRYMSPEQFRGEVADARSDQFSFCLTLYELFYGAHPFSGSTLAERIASFESEARRPEDTKLPDYLTRAVLRGLRVRAVERFETMQALLSALEPAPKGGRGRWVALGGVGVAALAIALLLSAKRAEAEEPCALSDTRIRSEWGGVERASVAFAMGDSELSLHVLGILDERADALGAGYRDNCEASYVRREQSEELADSRTLCLERHVLQFESIVDIYSSDIGEAKLAGAAELAFPALEQCANLEAMANIVVMPASASARAQIAVAERAGAKADAFVVAGLLEQAELATATSVELARAAGYPPVLGRALFTRLELQADATPSDAVDTARELLMVAASAHDDLLLSEIWPKLIMALGNSDRQDAAMALAPAAETALRRAESSPLGVATFYLRLAGVLQTWEPEKSLDVFDKAIEFLRLGDDENVEVNIAVVHNNVANTLKALGRNEEAVSSYEAALPSIIKGFGETHTNASLLRVNWAEALLSLGKTAQARELLEPARENLMQSLGTKHPFWALLLLTEGQLFSLEEDWALAIERSREAVQINIAHLGRGHGQTLLAYEFLAEVLAGSGELGQASDVYESIIAEREEAGDTPQEVVVLLVSATELLLTKPFADDGRFRGLVATYLARGEALLMTAEFPAGFSLVMYSNQLLAAAIDAKLWSRARALLALSTERASFADPQELRDTETLRLELLEKTTE